MLKRPLWRVVGPAEQDRLIRGDARSEALAAVCLALILAGCAPQGDQGGTDPVAARYFVDCGAVVQGDGSRSKPWNSLAAVNRHRFRAGERVQFRRGTICAGAFNPQGSGARDAPVIVDSYGVGGRPIIDAGANEYAIKLSNQSHWEIRNLETSGGTRYGIFVTVDAGVSEQIRLNNVVVRDVYGGEIDSKNTGLVVVSPTHDPHNTTNARFDDVVLRNLTAYNTNQWAGILIGTGTAADGWASNLEKRSSNVVVRNARVWNTHGDGIVLFAVNRGLIEHSVAHRTGLQPVQTIGTPNAIWTWSCMDCTVQHNEAYDNFSPGVDGGAFDIDWGNTNNIVQYNYGHDNSAYCIAIFGAAGLTTTNSIVRYNICANNGVAGTRQNKEIEISTWDGGTIDGLQIYNNTIYTTNGVFNSDFHSGGFTGDLPRFFTNNIVYFAVADAGEVGPLFDGVEGLERNHNLYYQVGGGRPRGEPHSLYANPRFEQLSAHGPHRFALRPDSPALDAAIDVCAGRPGCAMGERDFFGTPIPQGEGYDLGAYELPGGGISSGTRP